MSSANWSYFFSNLDSLYFFSSDYPGEDFQNYVEWKWQEWTFFSYSISFRGNAFSFSALSMMLALGLSYMAFIMLKNTKMKIWSYTEYIIQSNKNAFTWLCFLYSACIKSCRGIYFCKATKMCLIYAHKYAHVSFSTNTDSFSWHPAWTAENQRSDYLLFSWYFHLVLGTST